MQVEIWSDVVCPWCYIGKRRFETALASFEHCDDVEVIWRSFELDPTAPAVRSESNTERLASKYGMSHEQALASHQRLTQLAAEEGLTFHLDTARSGNTFDAHRLLALAAERGVQGELKERLMHAYFTEGLPIGETATLVQLADEVGIPRHEAEEALSSAMYGDQVRADEQEAQEFGISGVPFFVLDRRYGISGAQPASVFSQALAQTWAEGHPKLILTPIGAPASDETCTDETCAL